MKTAWKKGMLLLFTAALVLLTACNTSSAPKNASATPQSGSAAPGSAAPKSGSKQVTVGLSVSPESLNPIFTPFYSVLNITAMMFQPLLELNEDQKFVPMLADSVETKDNQTFVAKLNAKANWTDGKSVTADDVIFTANLIVNPKVSTQFVDFTILDGTNEKGQLPEGTTELKGIKKIDDKTVEFRTKTPVDPNLFKEKIGKNLKALPKHILQNAEPEKLHQHPFFQKPDVTDGPFKLVNYAKNQYLEFAANKDYFKGAPKLDKLFFKIMPEANFVAAYQNGEIDMNFPGQNGNIPVEDFEKVKSLSNVKTETGKALNFQGLFFNVNTVPDKVRQAIVYAMNRKNMVDNLLKGEGTVLDLPYSPVHAYFNKDLKPYTFDPEKAKSLLKEAGWDSNKTLSFIVQAGNKTRENVSNVIVDNLKDVGIKAQIQKLEITAATPKVRKGEFDIFIYNFAYYLDPDISIYVKTKGSVNWSGYSNPEVDNLLAQGLKEIDPKNRAPVYNKIQEIIARDVPEISLYADYRLKATTKRVIVGGPKELGMFINVHEWDVSN